MNETSIKELIKTSLCDGINVQKLEDDNDYIVSIPFSDYLGDEIEIGIKTKGDSMILDDLGRTSGLLFSIDQHKPDAPAHRLVKTLVDEYKITMDYNYGLVIKEVKHDDTKCILDFIKVITSLNTTIPKLKYQKAEWKRRKRLAVKLSKDIVQLQMPVYVQRHTKVEGKHFSWPVDYRYKWDFQGKKTDVLIVTTDLWSKEPQFKASQVISLATDLHVLNGQYDLRVLFELNGSRPESLAYRAAQFLIDQQKDLNYRVYNYADLDQKQNFMAKTLTELLPKIQALG